MADILRKQGRNIGSSGGSGGGGLTEEEHDALMSIASMPARGDFNPEKAASNAFLVYKRSDAIMRVCCIGYDKASIKFQGSGTSRSISFIDDRNTTISTHSLPNDSSWSNYFDVPNNAVSFDVVCDNGNLFYSLLTADSPYNPDNQ